MDEAIVRRIVKEELGALIKSDRFIFEKNLQFMDGRTMQFGRSTGTKIGTAADQKLSFYGVSPVVQPSSTGETTGASDADVQFTTTFNGNFGTKAYTIGDLVKHLKTIGILLKS